MRESDKEQKGCESPINNKDIYPLNQISTKLLLSSDIFFFKRRIEEKYLRLF